MDSAAGVCLPQDNSATFQRPLPRRGVDSAAGVCLPQDNSATFQRPLPRGAVDSGTGVCLPQDYSATFQRPLPRVEVDSGTGAGDEMNKFTSEFWLYGGGHRWIAWHGYYTLNSTRITKR